MKESVRDARLGASFDAFGAELRYPFAASTAILA